MSKTLLIDYNNLAMRMFFTSDILPTTQNPEYKLWRYKVVNAIIELLGQFRSTTEVVLAVDHKMSWRYFYFPRYKEDRKIKKRQSDVNWEVFHEQLSFLANDIKEHLPLKVICVKNAEADDVIGFLSRHINNKKIVISNDEDYKQLVNNETRVYNPKNRDFVECDDTEMFIIEKCLTGQAKDFILNIITPLDHPIDKKKPGFGPKSAQKVIKDGYELWLESKDLKDRFEFNRNLIDFNRIPNVVCSRIEKAYSEYLKPNPDMIYSFFKDNNFQGFLDVFDGLEKIFLNLY